MAYYKTIGDNGFVSISTVNSEGEGNILQTEYEQILQMIKAAPDGQGVVEDGDGYAYATYQVTDDASPEDIAEALEGVL